MNDFPIPEDPPVTITIEKWSKAPISEDMTLGSVFRQGDYPTLAR